jgi:hypothetical protein
MSGHASKSLLCAAELFAESVVTVSGQALPESEAWGDPYGR